MRVIAEEELERMLPRRVAVVEITLTDGTVLKETNDTVRGTPENPMSEDEIVGKARDLVAPVLGLGFEDRAVESARISRPWSNAAHAGILGRRSRRRRQKTKD